MKASIVLFILWFTSLQHRHAIMPMIPKAKDVYETNLCHVSKVFRDKNQKSNLLDTMLICFLHRTTNSGYNLLAVILS
jgi:hypothetical protein